MHHALVCYRGIVLITIMLGIGPLVTVGFGLQEKIPQVCTLFSPIYLLIREIRLLHLAGKHVRESDNGEQANQPDGSAKVDRQRLRSS